MKQAYCPMGRCCLTQRYSLKAPRATKESKAHKASKESKACKDPPDRRESKEREVHKASKESRVCKDPPDRRVKQDLRALRIITSYRTSPIFLYI